MATSPSGTLLAIAATFGAPKTVSGISNAAEAVVSCTAHGFSVGDIAQLYSGWGRLNRRAVRVKSATTDNFVAELIDTTSTDFFPSGTGNGTVRKVLTWQQISNYKDISSSGGEPKNITFKWNDSDVEESLNDGFSAITESFNIDADNIGQVGYELLRTYTDVQTDTILRKTLKSGSKIYTPGRVALNENVKFTDGQVNVCAVGFNANGRITRYSA